MRKFESVQMFKEQLKIQAAELRKIKEEKTQITLKIKDISSHNQNEIKKLKETLVKKDEEIKEQKDIALAARLSKHSGKTEESRADETPANANPILEKKIEELNKRSEKLRERIKEREERILKSQKEKDVLLKELKRLREDSNSIDNLKGNIRALKDELKKTKESSSSGLNPSLSPQILREKDEIIEKYEKMLYGGLDPEEEGMLPAEVIAELKEEIEDLEKERRNMIVELEMLREDNAEIEMKLTLLEEKKEGSGGGGDKGSYRSSDSRADSTAEFSAGLENFLVTYSDMMTLLLVIFVLMFTVSKMDEEKFADALSAFQEQRMKIEHVNVRLTPQEMTMLEHVRELVKDNVDAETLVRSDTRTILKRLPTSDLFGPGSADLLEGAKKLIKDAISEDTKEGVKQILVDGHTDNVPTHSDKFPSNWELSSARASTVARYIIDEMRFPPERIVVTGYGEYRPLKSNTSDEFRAINRRVEIKILKDIRVADREAERKKQANEKDQKENPSSTNKTEPAKPDEKLADTNVNK
ncbi:MAG: hypothetical protein COV66_14070 [Nitrospinae bacterium CG11_big_fil_rev_8_21_14_0_20_45_15]|nr:MAG: hypothetical protein COV66_14070 [Nitrospinae bacterium CG11_big_fil_rev_8_21_14_0_20_45_15]